MKARRVYIAGPMTGYEHYNFDAFDKVAHLLRQHGWLTINPANLDRMSWDFEGYPPDDLVPRLFKDKPALIKSCIRRDVNALLELSDGDAIYLLNGWEKSPGANGELAVFKWLALAYDLNIFTEESYPNYAYL